MEDNFVFVVFSNYNYTEHKYNILKECLGLWSSNDNGKFVPECMKIRRINISPDSEDRMYIVDTTKEWLRDHDLGSVIDNKLFIASTYF